MSVGCLIFSRRSSKEVDTGNKGGHGALVFGQAGTVEEQQGTKVKGVGKKNGEVMGQRLSVRKGRKENRQELRGGRK